MGRFLIPKYILLHIKYIEIEQKMTELADHRKSKMADAAILNSSVSNHLRPEHPFQDENIGSELHISSEICPSPQNGYYTYLWIQEYLELPLHYFLLPLSPIDLTEAEDCN